MMVITVNNYMPRQGSTEVISVFCKNIFFTTAFNTQISKHFVLSFRRTYAGGEDWATVAEISSRTSPLIACQQGTKNVTYPRKFPLAAPLGL